MLSFFLSKISAFLIFLIISFSNFLRLHNLQFKNIKKNILILILFPLIFSLTLSQLKESNLNYIKDKYIYKKDTSKIEYTLNTEYKILRNVNTRSFTSYRAFDWLEIYNKTKDKFLLGYGTQADRYLINQSASNALLYFFSSSGIVGFAIYLVIIFNLFKKLWLNLDYLKINSLKDKPYLFSLLICLTLLIRSIVESSFAVFGIDYVLFLISLFVISNEKRTKN